MRLIRYLVLPAEITPFERTYLARINRIALAFFALHPPAFALVAYLCGTSVPLAFGLGAVAFAGPALAYAALRAHPRVLGIVFAVTAMLMGGILVYVGQGPMQIEMHFYSSC